MFDSTKKKYQFSSSSEDILNKMWISRQSRTMYQVLSKDQIIKKPTKCAFLLAGRLALMGSKEPFTVDLEKRFDGLSVDLTISKFPNMVVEVDGPPHGERIKEDAQRDKRMSCENKTTVRICNEAVVQHLDIVIAFLYGVGTLQNKIDEMLVNQSAQEYLDEMLVNQFTQEYLDDLDIYPDLV